MNYRNKEYGPLALSQALLEGIRNSDETAFEVFYRMERNNLVHFINSYVHDIPCAEDLAQDSLLSLWSHRENLKSGENLRAYVFTIARNRTLDLLKSRSELLRNAEDVSAVSHLQENSLEERINALDLSQLVSKTFCQLPQKLQRTFLMSRVEGLTNREIALSESISEKSVEYRISRVLRLFRLEFEIHF